MKESHGLTRLFEQNANKAPAQCPFCKGRDTRLHALFGSQLSTSQHYCRACRVVFEEMKWDGSKEQP